MLAVGGNINLAIGGEPIFPFIPKDILAGQFRGKWENTPDGPAAWRRGVYVYRRRSLPYPMFDTFDHPDMNVTAGAQKRLDRADAGADAAEQPVRAVAGRAAGRSREPRGERSVGADRSAPTGSRWPGRRRRPRSAIATDLIRKQSLAAFTHVLLNLDEFVYMR